MASFIWWSSEQILWSTGSLILKNLKLPVITPGAECFTSNTLAKVVKIWLLFSTFRNPTKWWVRVFWTNFEKIQPSKYSWQSHQAAFSFSIQQWYQATEISRTRAGKTTPRCDCPGQENFVTGKFSGPVGKPN